MVLLFLAGVGVLALRHLRDSESLLVEGCTPWQTYKASLDNNTHKISYGSMDLQFNDRTEFPFFYRTVPNDYSQFSGMIQLLNFFRWNWVGILTSDDEGDQRGSEQLKKEIIRSGSCVAFLEAIPLALFLTDQQIARLDWIFDMIQKSLANVVIMYSTSSYLTSLICNKGHQKFKLAGKQWVLSTAVSSLNELHSIHIPRCVIFNGSLGFAIPKGEILGFKDFLYNIYPSTFPDPFIVQSLWREAFFCELPYRPLPTGFPECTGKERLSDFSVSEFDVDNFRLTYSIYLSVYAMAHALKNMFTVKHQHLEHRIEFLPWKLNQYIKRVRFKTPNGHEILFNENGEVPTTYDIINWVMFSGWAYTSINVGSFNPSAPKDQQLTMNQSAIFWNPHFKQTPRSVCSESCASGYRKVFDKQKPICCFDCFPCAEGEYSNRTDAENCLKCPEDQWPNEKKVECITRLIEFLSYTDPLGAIFTSTAIVFSIVNALVLSIFIKYRDTPLVKANNQELSYILLVFLMLSFLCSLMFIGYPGNVTCLIQQVAFGIIFTIVVSSVLAKTIIVLIAFNATKPRSKLSKWVGTRVSSYLLFLCSSGEVVICIIWLLISPPFPEYDTQSEPGKMILKCNEGSTIAFYSMIGYIGFLAFLSFIVAFLARNLPDSFNEAQHITFSMLVFCSVWISFIPAYLSAKGKYMVAVEIFAILASSAGLLGCIFIPKCYIILFRPDLNTRGHLIEKQNFNKPK
ncbi:vomeronasal type-2 receptor 26-like [Microcaecilia unicolor]|uniref:Vomeronasal type-2 receptor 26-like n=1 Tax=Microcaecilia unicolor TaxID=1415580 RepID=A0A6P7WKM8_9AMPH|nr:vomeronasal type-2 receptor 26-like [Microcaecilia unicolor]